MLSSRKKMPATIWPQSGTMQRRRSYQNSCSIHVYVVPEAAEYVQRRVRFANVELSLPENVVLSVCAHMGNAAYIIFIMHVEFHFRFGHLVLFPVERQLRCGCHGEKSSNKIWNNSLIFIFDVLSTSEVIFTFFSPLHFLGLLYFWGHHHFWGRLHFWGHLHFWGCFHFWGHLPFWGHLHFIMTAYQSIL